MKARSYLVLAGLTLMLLSLLTWQAAYAVERSLPESVVGSVVQLIAADEGRSGQLIPRWSGSGTIVSKDGLILTNCQVAMPRAIWDDPDFDYDLLIVAVATRPTLPPQPMYIADVVQCDAALDLAVIRITQSTDGSLVRPEKLTLPALPLGDSDALKTGDTLYTFGYSGASGQPITSITGTVTGFSSGRGIKGRAWIRTDAAVAGGLSGGPAVDERGQLMGVPAVGAADSAEAVAHCRYSDDSNGDGTIDLNDTCTSTGGAIQALRPIALAKPLIQAAARRLAPEPTAPPKPQPTQGPAQTPQPTGSPTPQPTKAPPQPTGSPTLQPTKAPPQPTPEQPQGKFGRITFAEGVDRNGKPVKPGTSFRTGLSELHALFDYWGMENGVDWTQRWYVNGELVVDKSQPWDSGESGQYHVGIYSRSGSLPAGEYRLELLIGEQVVQQGACAVGKQPVKPSPTPSSGRTIEVYGRITDAYTGHGISGALFLVLQPGVSLDTFLDTMDENLVYTQGLSDRYGYYQLSQPLVAGHRYSMLVIAVGYMPVRGDDILIKEDAPSPWRLDIRLEPIY